MGCRLPLLWFKARSQSHVIIESSTIGLADEFGNPVITTGEEFHRQPMQPYGTRSAEPSVNMDVGKTDTRRPCRRHILTNHEVVPTSSAQEKVFSMIHAPSTLECRKNSSKKLHACPLTWTGSGSIACTPDL